VIFTEVESFPVQSNQSFVTFVAVSVLFLSTQVVAQTTPERNDAGASSVAGQWTGFYGGVGLGHANYQSGMRWVLSTAAPTGFVVAGRVGYDRQIGSWVVGAFADVQAGSGKKTFDDSLGNITDLYDWKSQRNFSLNARIGHAFGSFLPYLTVGYTLGEMSAANTNIIVRAGTILTGIGGSDGRFNVRANGVNIGAGVEYMMTPNVSLFADYRHVFARRTSVGSSYVSVHATTGLSTIGVNYRF
jgi:opacity protein-like surface antigen